MNNKDRIAKKNQFDGSLVFGTKNFNEKTARNDHVHKATELHTTYFYKRGLCEVL